MKAIINDPAKAGQRAGKQEIFGDRSRYAVYPVHTRFEAVQWFVADAEIVDGRTGQPEIVRQAATREEAIAGLGVEEELEQDAYDDYGEQPFDETDPNYLAYLAAYGDDADGDDPISAMYGFPGKPVYESDLQRMQRTYGVG